MPLLLTVQLMHFLEGVWCSRPMLASPDGPPGFFVAPRLQAVCRSRSAGGLFICNRVLGVSQRILLRRRLRQRVKRCVGTPPGFWCPSWFGGGFVDSRVRFDRFDGGIPASVCLMKRIETQSR